MSLHLGTTGTFGFLASITSITSDNADNWVISSPAVVTFSAPAPAAVHDFSLRAGRGEAERIVICSRCGAFKLGRDTRDMGWLVCVLPPGEQLRDRIEFAIGRAQRKLDFVAMFTGEPARRPGPAYQNVSAVVRNVVGGWNRR